MGLLYISNGNIPSRWAHTFQIMKISEAFGRLVPDFRLMVAVDILNTCLRRRRGDLWDWYGIRTPFAIRRVPVAWRADPVFEASTNDRFCRIAPLVARLSRPRIVLTRSPTAALRSLRLRLPTIFEVYAGHLYDYKGIATLLDAAKLLSEVCLALVGGWPEDNERWRQYSADAENISFQGFVPNRMVPEYLAAAELCVATHSARHESAEWTSPLKLCEYMTARRPIVATDIPAIRDLIVDGRNALLVPADDAQALAAAVRRLLDHPALAESLAAEARNDVEACGWQARARRILERFAPESLGAHVGSEVA